MQFLKIIRKAYVTKSVFSKYTSGRPVTLKTNSFTDVFPGIKQKIRIGIRVVIGSLSKIYDGTFSANS